MFITTSLRTQPACCLDPLDRLAVGYLGLPLALFLAGWFEWWVAAPLIACVAYAFRSLWNSRSGVECPFPLSRLHITVAIVVGCGWTLLGGADHVVFANPDWYVRDAVLHDLVVSPWPVGYGLLDGRETLLRAPLGFYLPAALVGKWLGLSAAHVFMGLWTATGSVLFLLQVLSLTPSRAVVALTVVAVILLFSGMDIVGELSMEGPRFRAGWNITTHLEWWAHKFQYSSMTTQLFWVPNHALGGWLSIGFLFRNKRSDQLNTLLPMIVVALALWSPLTALGLVPFVLLRAGFDSIQERSWQLFHPKVWGPALVVGIVIAAYLILDPSRIPKGFALGGPDTNLATDLLQHAQFYFLEAGCIGAALLAIHRSRELLLALTVLAILPFVYLGPGNDLVMRASIPSLVVLAIGVCLALVTQTADTNSVRKKVLLTAILLVGAVTPAEEFARALILPAIPINMMATLIEVNCGQFAPHYVARVGGSGIDRLLRPTHRLTSAPIAMQTCDNPAMDLMLNWRFTRREYLRPNKPALNGTGIS